MLLNGFQVDTDGNINLPSVGKLMVVGKTLKELNTIISKYLIEKKVLNNPTIQIKVLNLHFTVLGEVNISWEENTISQAKIFSKKNSSQLNGPIKLMPTHQHLLELLSLKSCIIRLKNLSSIKTENR